MTKRQSRVFKMQDLQKNGHISCVIFDLDNTLVGIPNLSHYIRGVLLDCLLQEYDVTLEKPNDSFKLFTSGKGHIAVLESWGVEDSRNFWEVFDRYDFEKRKALYVERELFLYKDVLPCLNQLRDLGLKLAVASNTANFIANWEVENFKLTEYFDLVRGLGDVQENAKPEPEGLLQVLDELDAIPEKTLYIGDSPVDLEACLRANLAFLWIKRQENYTDEEQYAHVKKRFREILEKNEKTCEDLRFIEDLELIIPLVKARNQ